jgi:glycosyltransferase involved in cell wall biosynthesis/GT2 family glycosyltransferase
VKRAPILYLAPWVDYGGTDKNTIDWFRGIDRERFAPSLITTQPSPNRRLREVAELAEEIWVLPDLMPAERMPAFILDFLHSREVRIAHLMNSRLSFDLLPDIACLPRPPGVVVQLHVEEPDRSGYVRYVTTRYGNLVDRFSVASGHLAHAVHDYGVPPDRTKVIYIGVDAEREFSPERVEPLAGLAEDRMHILFPARLVEQKDPLLMVEVAAALRDRGVGFQLHVLGEGELESEVRARIAERGLGEEVLIHPPTSTPQRWYAACDALLLTSLFEGVPAAVFEAMAMGLPIVGPALPGNTELLGEDRDGLVEPRDSVEGYADGLARLAGDRDLRSSRGRELRERALRRFSLRRMADEHEQLYEEVLDERPRAPAAAERDAPERIRFRDRPLYGAPLVSVLVPHYNQAQFLGECIDSVWTQSYPEIELVVVDDASTDRDADAALDELEAHDDVAVLRLEQNGGPSRARNLGLDLCSGRYILPMDADNVLLPDAIEGLVEQLGAAGEDVGFIYPNLQFFGNREDYYEAPPYNLHALLQENFCDTCSLLDRTVFDAGERYGEDIRLGHEDWEFFLRLAARGVRGEAANRPTIRYRKWGFNRCDRIEHGAAPFQQTLTEPSPLDGLESEIKAKESPALSVAALQPLPAELEARRTLATRLAEQRCIDVELITSFDGEWPASGGAPPIRRIPPALAGTPLDVLGQARLRMRGSFLAATSGTATDLLADPAFVDKVLRRFVASEDSLDAIALVDAGDDGRYPLRALPPGEIGEDATAHTVVWRTAAEAILPRGLHADPSDPVDSIARLLSGAGAQIEWRHWPASNPNAPRRRSGSWSPVQPPRGSRPHSARPAPRPLLPGAGEYSVPRWERTPTWVPPLSVQASRYRSQHGQTRIVTTGPPPSGHVLEHRLGSLRSTGMEGTERLLRIDGDYRTVPRGEWHPLPADAEEIGYLELAPIPQMTGIALAVHRSTGQSTLVSLPDDPIIDEVDIVRQLGFVEPYPITPTDVPDTERALGLVGLVKSVDLDRRRHRYAIGGLPDGELVGELGALAESHLQASIAAWVVDGQLVTERHRPPATKPTSVDGAGWALEPAAWAGIATRQARARTVARRATIAATRLASRPKPPSMPDEQPAGWLYGAQRPGLAALYASYHPVTGDQLLTRTPDDAAEMGYGAAELIGFVRLLAPLTGDLSQRIFPVPWARRFGAVPRVG